MLRSILNEGAELAMDFYLQRLQNAISATAGMNAEKLALRPGADKWCVAEILEHLYLTYTGTIKGFEKCLQAGTPLARPTLQDRMRTMVVVSLGTCRKAGNRPRTPSRAGFRPIAFWQSCGEDCRHGRNDYGSREEIRK